MATNNTIQVWEWDTLRVGRQQGGAVFDKHHFNALKEYLTANPDCGFYSLLDEAVRFNQYVGALQVGDLCIEVLPKTDRSTASKAVWQGVLIDMIFISHRVPVSVTTQAQMMIHRRRVLDAYFGMFMDEAAKLLHEGLAKKYRRNESNQTALRGRLLFGQQVRHNVVHAERFYVAHTVYDRDNGHNAILLKTLRVMNSLPLPQYLSRQIAEMLAFFPECSDVSVNDRLFRKLSYDRKTTRYRRAISFAEIILRQYHPDVRSGRQPMLAIMFDMNVLWESFIYDTLARALSGHDGAGVYDKPTKDFYHSKQTGNFYLEPDILLTLADGRRVVIDTKWKYNQRTSIADLRQMYAYGHYFGADQSFLLYPQSNRSQSVMMHEGVFASKGFAEQEPQYCGLMYADLIQDSALNPDIGKDILACINL